jgi:hypothetical protein
MGQALTSHHNLAFNAFIAWLKGMPTVSAGAATRIILL